MAIARSTADVFDYVPKSDRELDPDKQTTFQLRALPHKTFLRVAGLHEVDVATAVELACRAGIAGWSNLQTATGEPVEARFEPRKINLGGVVIEKALTERSWNLLPSDLMQELAAEIINHNQVSETDAGN